jgi:nitrate reductase NapAB chaperone NapD
MRSTEESQAIGAMPAALIHAVTEHGKLVVTLEGRHASEVANQTNAIHARSMTTSVVVLRCCWLAGWLAGEDEDSL